MIVNARPESPAAAFGADELALALRRVTGGAWPVLRADEAPAGAPRIVVGGVDGYADQEYHVFTRGDDLHLAGGGERGALYAVYSYLEDDLGLRWYTVREDGDFVPPGAAFRMPKAERRARPAFAARHFTNYYFPAGPGPERFFARNKLNVDMRLPAGVGGDLPTLGPGVHSLFFYAPPEETPALSYYTPWPSERGLFARHPEYFSQDAQGRRVANRQVCFANPDLRRLLTRHLLERLEADGGRGVVEVSANDVPGAFCFCDGCKALEKKYGCPGGPLYDYLIEAAPEIARAYPHAFVRTLAYRRDQSETPPRVKRLPDNLIVTFAPIDADFAQTLDHPSNRAAFDNLRQWCRIARRVWVWYYPNPYGHAKVPIGNLRKLAHDIRLLHDAGVAGAYFEHDVDVMTGLNWAELQSWVMAKLFGRPDRPLAPLVETFTDFYYGDAAEGVRNYLEELEQAREAMRTPLSWDPSWEAYPYFTPERLGRWQGYFDAWLEKLAPDSDAAGRVRLLRVTLDLATLFHWRAAARAGVEFSFDLPTLAARAVREYAAGARRTAPDAKNHPAEDALAERYAHLVLPVSVEPKPLPPPFDKRLPDRAAQLFPRPPLVDDADAALGKAARKALAEAPLTMGVYDATERRWLLSRTVPKDELRPGAYHFYRVGRTRVTPDCVFWLTQSWFATVPLSAQYRVGFPDAAWDVYASVKVDGPAYGGDADREDSVALDRLLLLPAGK